jgi:DNA-binding beta-propeller fold protein YncE/mono/diheme cytochrome c family protein
MGRARLERAGAALACGALLLGALSVAAAGVATPGPRFQQTSYRDGHARPRALAYNPADGLLYVALSTADAVAVVSPGPAPRVVARLPACRFPEALAALPEGGALVACRFGSGLWRVARERAGERDRWRVRLVARDSDAGARGLALGPTGRVAYVASAVRRGVDVVALSGARLQTLATGISPRALRVVPAGLLPGRATPLLLVSNFIDHTVTVHPIGDDGRLAGPTQTIRTEAPVLDMMVVGQGASAALWLLTHEDRAVSRANGPVEGLDSGVIALAAGAATSGAPFVDPGPGRRPFVNLGDRPQPVIELASGVRADADPATFAMVGAGSDNLLIGDARQPLATARVVDVGANPSAVAALPGGRFVTADRLSDTLTFVAGGGVTATLVVGAPERTTPAARGELLFYSRALVPNNVAAGPRSLYTCAACHDNGHIDGRRHPAKRNRFFSMTESCRGLGTTAPYLTLGDPQTIDAFADNIVATHAQGAEDDPAHFDKYPVTLRLRGPGGWGQAVLSPADVRQALARYMEQIPPEPSPFAAPALTDEQRRGLALFRDDCAGCHQLVGNTARPSAIPPAALERRLLAGEVALTSPRRFAVGTPVLGDGGNNPPSLRGVWDAAPYFSDGSVSTLEDLLRRTDPDVETVHAPENATRPPAFTDEERASLLAFLKAL